MSSAKVVKTYEFHGHEISQLEGADGFEIYVVDDEAESFYEEDEAQEHALDLYKEEIQAGVAAQANKAIGRFI